MIQAKDQHNVGTPKKPRGQQTGFAGHADQNRQEVERTPAVSGNRKKSSRLYADRSSQQISSDLVTPSSNSPSTPAMNTPSRGESGGEGVFKRKLAKSRRNRK